MITTKAEFDREEQAVYAVIIEAEDGAPSSLLQNGQPNVTPQKFRIAIADKNDNPPYFPQSTYHAEVIEVIQAVLYSRHPIDCAQRKIKILLTIKLH